MPGQPYPSYPEADRASPEYAYVDPKSAFYDIAKLPREYHPLDAWNTLGKDGSDAKFHRTFYPAVGVASAFVGSFVHNYHLGAPLWASLPRTIVMALVGAGIGEYAWNRSLRINSERDANIKLFLETHYDEFPKVKRVKYGEMFLPWRVTR